MKTAKSTVLIIDSKTHGIQAWREIFQYKDLFYFLSVRDLKVRYRQTIIGFGWAIIRPIFSMVILSLIFGTFASFPSGNVPYPILVYTAILPWTFFSSFIGDVGNSFVGNLGLLTKVYFPRLIFPLSRIVVNLVDFLISFGILLLLMMWYQYVPSWAIITLPVFLIISIIFALGPGIMFAALNVKYRDAGYILALILQFGFYLSPVGYSISIIPEQLKLIYSLNPMVGVIEGFRWAILGTELYLPGFILSIIVSLLFLPIGIWYFIKTEDYFADIL